LFIIWYNTIFVWLIVNLRKPKDRKTDDRIYQIRLLVNQLNGKRMSTISYYITTYKFISLCDLCVFCGFINFNFSVALYMPLYICRLSSTNPPFYAKRTQFSPFLAQKQRFGEKTNPNEPNSNPIKPNFCSPIWRRCGEKYDGVILVCNMWGFCRGYRVLWLRA